MTAIDKYLRLEALGHWRERAGAPPREVVFSFGRSTLVLSDLDDRPLGHWALAGVAVVGRDGAATVYAMTPGGGETLTLRDPEMVAAIAAVARAALGPVARPARPRRRVPLGPLLGAAALIGITESINCVLADCGDRTSKTDIRMGRNWQELLGAQSTM